MILVSALKLCLCGSCGAFLQAVTSFWTFPASPSKACGGEHPCRRKRLVFSLNVGSKVSESCSFIRRYIRDDSFDHKVILRLSAAEHSQRIEHAGENNAPTVGVFFKKSTEPVHRRTSGQFASCFSVHSARSASTPLTLLECLLFSLLSRLANFEVPSCKTKRQKCFFYFIFFTPHHQQRFIQKKMFRSVENLTSFKLNEASSWCAAGRCILPT